MMGKLDMKKYRLKLPPWYSTKYFFVTLSNFILLLFMYTTRLFDNAHVCHNTMDLVTKILKGS